MDIYNKLDKRVLELRRKTKLPLNKRSMQYYALNEFLKLSDTQIINIIGVNLGQYRIFGTEKRLKKLKENGIT